MTTTHGFVVDFNTFKYHLEYMFAGSNATGEAAEGIGRLWIAFEINSEYLDGSMLRFDVREKTDVWKEL
jgi:hypothetical protein